MAAVLDNSARKEAEQGRAKQLDAGTEGQSSKIEASWRVRSGVHCRVGAKRQPRVHIVARYYCLLVPERSSVPPLLFGKKDGVKKKKGNI